MPVLGFGLRPGISEAIGVYEVNNSIVDVWIMLIMGVVGYALKKFAFDPALLVLGLVISPILGVSLLGYLSRRRD